MSLINQVASDAVIDEAFAWLCSSREHHSANSDVWHLRFHWDDIKPQLQADLLTGHYRFDVVRRFQSGEDLIEYWSARDAVVIKAMTLVLGDHLRPHLSDACHHLMGNGGAKAAVRRVTRAMPQHAHVFRSDVLGYYANIDHDVLTDQLRQSIDDDAMLDLLGQYMKRTLYEDELYTDITRGISFGCSLSPLMGALYLKPLDDLFEGDSELFYARFMDDWVILSPSRWKLRKAVAKVNQTLDALRVKQHPDKTFIGRTCRGFDFLGYAFGVEGLQVAKATVEQARRRVDRLYEQGADESLAIRRIGQYVRRWWSWATGGLGPKITLRDKPERLWEILTQHVGDVPARGFPRSARLT